MIGGITSFDIIQLLLFMNVDKDVFFNGIE